MRRRREPVIPWLRWIAAGVVPFLVALAVAEFLVLVGQAPDAPPVPLPPSAHPLDGSAVLTLGVCTVFFVLAWLFLRPLLAARPGPADSPGAGGALALVLAVASIAVWVVNPFAALALLPAFHLWLLVTASPTPPARPVGLTLVGLGLLVPLLIGLAILYRLSLGPLSGLWYGFLLVTGHSVGFGASLVGCLLLGCACATIEIAWRTRGTPKEEADDEGGSLFGPGRYAGPGSLGGTQSALRR